MSDEGRRISYRLKDKLERVTTRTLSTLRAVAVSVVMKAFLIISWSDFLINWQISTQGLKLVIQIGKDSYSAYCIHLIYCNKEDPDSTSHFNASAVG